MSGISRIWQKTENSHLNFFELTAVKRNGTEFPYYMASRARNERELRMQSPGKGPDGTAIFGIYGEKKDRVVLIRQFRYPLGGYVYELPAGLLEKNEDIHEAAIREMKEETGLDLSPIDAERMFEKPFYTTVGMTDENCCMVYGYCSGKISTRGQEDTEDIQVILADRTEVIRILREEQTALICAYMLMHFLASPGDPFSFLHCAED